MHYSASHFDAWEQQYEADIRRYKDTYPFAGYFDIVRHIKAHIRSHRVETVLDIGIGTGLMLRNCARDRPALKADNCYGLDFSENRIAFCKARNGFANSYVWNIADAHPHPAIGDVEFDLILAAYVLHHFSDEQKIAILNTYTGLLRENGVFLIADLSFEDRARRDAVRAAEPRWDHEEEDGYFLADVFLKKLRALGAYSVQYKPISYCSARYAIERSASSTGEPSA